MEFKHEVIGTVDGITIAACTDSGGAQVIVGKREEKIHMLSKDYGTHAKAVAAAKRIVKHNHLPTTGDGYYNLKNESDGLAAFTAMIFNNSKFARGD